MVNGESHFTIAICPASRCHAWAVFLWIMQGPLPPITKFSVIFFGGHSVASRKRCRIFFFNGKPFSGPCATRICGALSTYPQGVSLQHHATAIRLQWQTHNLALRVTERPTRQHRVGQVGPEDMVARTTY